MANINLSKGFERRLEKILKERIKLFREKIDGRIGNIVLRQMVRKIKSFTRKGISPVTGPGIRSRYKGYKRASDKDGYPNNVRRSFPQKRKRPVNLRLSGKMMRSLDGFVRNTKEGVELELAYLDPLSRKKERGHSEGVGGQPKRPTLPGKGQKFSKDIEKEVVSILLKAIKK